MFKKIFVLVLVICSCTAVNVKGIAEEDTRKVAYLTFDDGPSKNTEKVLDILKKENLKATFFVVGPLKEEDSCYLKRAYEEGHVIGNHTYDHDFEDIYISEDAFWKNYRKGQGYIKEITGEESKIFRFPGGSFNHEVKNRNGRDFNSKIGRKLIDMGVKYYDWNVDSGDGMQNNLPPEAIVNNIIRESKGKDTIIVLMHDSLKKNTTIQALPAVIRILREKGYEFDTLNNFSE